MRVPGESFLTPQVPVLLRLLFLAQTFTVFFTGVKILPGLRNNFGPFELIGGAMVVAFVVSRPGGLESLRGHPVIRIQAPPIRSMVR